MYRCLGGILSVSEKRVLSFLFQIFCSVDRLLFEVMEKKEHVEVIFKNVKKIVIFANDRKRAVKSLHVYQLKGREEKGRTFVSPDKDRVLRAQRARLFPRQDF